MKKLFISIIRNVVVPELIEFITNEIRKKGGDVSHIPSKSDIEAHLVARSMEVLHLEPYDHENTGIKS